jgi:hypothetical protein
VNNESTLPLEHFIQAVQSQLDNAQTAMAVKARNLNLPLTFAIKDITLDLRAHVEFARSEIRIRPAGVGDKEASLFHLVFTAITRPMIEENAIAFAETPEDRSLEELKDDLTEDERRRLEWVGVRTVSKLREIEEQGAARTVGRVTNLPVERIRRALQRDSEPMVEHVLPAQRTATEPTDLPNLVRIRGRNLIRGGLPRVTVGGEPVSVVRAAENEVVIAPLAHQMAGELVIEPSPKLSAAMAFDLRPFWLEPSTAHAADEGGAS